MKRILLVFMCLLPFTAGGQVIVDKPLSARLTGYDIDVTLDPGKHTVSGQMTAWWVNHSSMPVGEAMMHMYLNAFSSNKSTFASGGRWSASGDDGWGWVKIKSMRDGSGNDLMGSCGYVAPDDGNENDKTVLRVVLPEPVAPGDTLVLKIDFISKLPSPIQRTGYDDDFHFVAQWFPKFGVYETAGMRQRETDGWNCHQFHPNSEFYSNLLFTTCPSPFPPNLLQAQGENLLRRLISAVALRRRYGGLRI